MKKTYTRIVHLVMLMNLFLASALPASVVAVEQLESTTSQEQMTTTVNKELTTETSQQTEPASERWWRQKVQRIQRKSLVSVTNGILQQWGKTPLKSPLQREQKTGLYPCVSGKLH